MHRVMIVTRKIIGSVGRNDGIKKSKRPAAFDTQLYWYPRSTLLIVLNLLDSILQLFEFALLAIQP